MSAGTLAFVADVAGHWIGVIVFVLGQYLSTGHGAHSASAVVEQLVVMYEPGAHSVHWIWEPFPGQYESSAHCAEQIPLVAKVPAGHGVGVPGVDAQS